MSPHEALEYLRPGDVALGRLDVLPSLDGVEDGLWALGALSARDVVVLNDASALLATHDKLLTARLLRRAGLPHPRTTHVRPGRDSYCFDHPVVLKPRFGSWGRDVERSTDADSFAAALARAKEKPWYERQGLLIQELVPPVGFDLRLVVANRRVIGGVYRIAPKHEWRTNVALGAVRRPVETLPQAAAALALAAAETSGVSLVGVDLLPDRDGRWTVLELNGAVEFTPEYALQTDVYSEAALALQRAARERALGGRNAPAVSSLS